MSYDTLKIKDAGSFRAQLDQYKIEMMSMKQMDTN
jgi:hypothetical protein